MQVPIINGIYTDEGSDFRTAYPVNMIPVPKPQGISNGYLRPADGIVSYGDIGFGINRGGINWNGECYRVMGTSLVSIDKNGSAIELGTIGGTDLVTFNYSFDYLSISANGNLYYWDGITLSQVTDTDLGTVVDHIWVDGYFMTTDGENLVVTELADPFSVLPTKYGSSEVDPDPVKALLKPKDEPYVINRYTIEVFSNVGGTGFPFQRIDGAMMSRGAIGTHACCIFPTDSDLDGVAFLGSGRNEPASIWLGSNGNTVKLATREIDQLLQDYSEAQLSEVLFEKRVDKSHELLYIHLPDQTLVYDGKASQLLQEAVWFILSSGLATDKYRVRHMIWCYDKWLVADTNSGKVGYLTSDVSSHWGTEIGWEFSTPIVYNEGKGAIFHELELVCLTGRVALNDDPRISTEYSLDGETWSQPKYIKAGKQGQRKKRLVWLNQGSMRAWRVQRFKGTSKAHLSAARLEARIEPLMI